MSSISDLGRAYLLGPSAAPEYEPNKTDGVVAFVEIERRIASVETDFDEALALVSAGGARWLTEVAVMATGNIVVATGLTAGTVVNGVTLTTGMRVLLPAQTAAAENGIYVAVASGASARAADCNTAAEIVGSAVYVAGGTVGAGRQYILTTKAPLTLGTTGLVYTMIADTVVHNAAIATLNSWMAGIKARVTGMSAPIRYDHFNRTIDIPAMVGINGTSGWTLGLPAGQSARRLTDASSTVSVVYVDLADLAANGPTSATAVKILAAYPPSLIHGSSTIALLGIVYARKFYPAPYTISPPVILNECGVGRDDNDLAALIYSGGYPTNLTRAESLALGFARGWCGTNDTGMYYGDYFESPIIRGVVIYKFFLESDDADTFGSSVQAQLVTASGSFVVMTPSLERSISSNLRVYSGSYRLTGGGLGTSQYVGMRVGSTSSTQRVRAFGLQFAIVGDEVAGSLSEGDYPRRGNLVGPRLRAVESAVTVGNAIDDALIPPLLCMVDKPDGTGGYQLFVDQLFKHPANPVQVAISSFRADRRRPLDVKATGPVIDLPPARLGTDIRMLVHDRDGRKDTGWARTIETRVVSAASVAGKPLIVHMMGDSITAMVGTGPQLFRRLRDLTGLDPVMIGTIDLRDWTTLDSLTVRGEGRSSREWADYINLYTSDLSPLAIGGEAGYLAASLEARSSINPYIRPAVAGDDPAKIINGFVYDFRFYLDRFGYPDPTHIPLNLGTNDMSLRDDATSLANIERGLDIVIPSMLSACPAVKIQLIGNSYRHDADDVRWNGEHRAACRALLRRVATLADARVTVVPMWALVSRENGFSITIGSSDPDTGVYPYGMVATSHYGPYGLHQYADVLAQWIVAV